jgi:hypothetical protein
MGGHSSAANGVTSTFSGFGSNWRALAEAPDDSMASSIAMGIWAARATNAWRATRPLTGTEWVEASTGAQDLQVRTPVHVG